MATVPHFDLPFRFGPDGHAVTIEQDSEDDVINCVEAIVRTPRGMRDDIPDFGIDDQTFRSIPLDIGLLAENIISQEPRAFIVVEQSPDRLSNLVQNIQVGVAISDSGEVNTV